MEAHEPYFVDSDCNFKRFKGKFNLDGYKNSYLCVIKSEFIPKLNNEHSGYAWCSFRNWPKPLHLGLRNTLQSKANLTKLETVFETINLLDK